MNVDSHASRRLDVEDNTRVCVASAATVFAWNDQAVFVGEDDGLDAVSQREFVEDVVDVRLDGCFADEQRLCDLGVGAAFDHMVEDFAFPGGQPLENCGWTRGGVLRRVVNASMRRLVMLGDTSAPPSAAARTPRISSSGRECLRRKPQAPALSAS